MNENFLEILNSVSNYSECLSKVIYVFDKEIHDRPEAIVLYFGSEILTIKVLDEDDTLILNKYEIKCNKSQSLVDYSDKYPWSVAFGKPIRWGWLLTNQQGYLDGIQFEFASNIVDKEVIIQLVAAASSLNIYEFNKC